MAVVPEELKEAAEKLRNGEHPKASVREFLSWFGAARRRHGVVSRIREALDEVGLATYPDFEGEWIDATIYLVNRNYRFGPQPVHDGETAKVVDLSAESETTGDATATATVEQPFEPVDPSHRLGRLRAANTSPVYVAPDETLERATTLMLINDFSQLPVMIGDREVKGLISWKSIGSRLALDRDCTKVRDCMDKHQELPVDASLFDAIDVIAVHDCVLVRNREKKISGIVTAADINAQYHQLAEPFLLLADIEAQIRNLLAPRFSREDLQRAKDPADTEREIENVSDMTFGEYVRLLENGEMWDKLGLRIDRKTFVKNLDEVRETRNDVMHFDPDGPDDATLDRLRSFAQCLARIHRIIV